MIHHCSVTVLNITRSVINVSWQLVGNKIYLVLTFILFNSFKASSLYGSQVTYQWEWQRGDTDLGLTLSSIQYHLQLTVFYMFDSSSFPIECRSRSQIFNSGIQPLNLFLISSNIKVQIHLWAWMDCHIASKSVE